MLEEWAEGPEEDEEGANEDEEGVAQHEDEEGVAQQEGNGKEDKEEMDDSNKAKAEKG